MRKKLTETGRMDRYSDNLIEYNAPDLLSRYQMTEFDDGDLNNRRNSTEQNSVEQRVLEVTKKLQVPVPVRTNNLATGRRTPYQLGNRDQIFHCV